MLGVRPSPSESVVSLALGGLGGLTVSGEVAGFLEPGDDGDFEPSAPTEHGDDDDDKGQINFATQH